MVFLARNFGILIKDTLEVLCGDWVDDILVLLSSHFRVQIEDRVVGLMCPDAVQTIIQTANIYEAASNSKTAAMQCWLAINLVLVKLFPLTKDCRHGLHLPPT